MPLFGRRKRAASVARDRLFALSTAQVTLEVELGLKTAGAELFATHPPLEKRIARLAEISREMGRPVA